MVTIAPLTFSGSTGTLAGVTGISMGGVSTAFEDDFLCKKIRAHLWGSNWTAGDGLIIGIARGTATVAEIKTALTTSPTSMVETNIEGATKLVFFETVRVITATDGHNEYDIDVSLGGGRGIPLANGHGYQLFVYNPTGSALSSSVLISCIITLYGVWLG